MGVLPEGWRVYRNLGSEDEATRIRRRHAAMRRRHDRAMRLRRLWRRAKLPPLLVIGTVGLSTALLVLSPSSPIAMPWQAAAQTYAGHPAMVAEPSRVRSPMLPAEFAGRVVGVSDGDTLTVLTAARDEVRVRLAEIDAPESGQPYGARAKQALSDLTYGRQVRVAVVDIDRYDRVVGRVHAGSRDVNAEMVRQGAAWVFVRFSRDPALSPMARPSARPPERAPLARPPARPARCRFPPGRTCRPGRRSRSAYRRPERRTGCGRSRLAQAWR
jgi:endonuclease YncB( thermonuclease family)